MLRQNDIYFCITLQNYFPPQIKGKVSVNLNTIFVWRNIMTYDVNNKRTVKKQQKTKVNLANYLCRCRFLFIIIILDNQIFYFLLPDVKINDYILVQSYVAVQFD